MRLEDEAYDARKQREFDEKFDDDSSDKYRYVRAEEEGRGWKRRDRQTDRQRPRDRDTLNLRASPCIVPL